MFTIGGVWPNGFNYIQMEAPMIYLAGNFTRSWQFNTHNHHFQNNTHITGIIPVAMGTEDGHYVIGVYAPSGQDTAHPQYYGTYPLLNIHSFAGSTSKLSMVFSKRKPVKTTTYTYTTYLCVGSLHMVKDCLTKVSRQHQHI